jgi:N-acylneuraminate cytidylyltransferase
MRRPRRQDFDGLLVENGAFYITSRQALLQSKCRISGAIKTIVMAPDSYMELDEPDDWMVVEKLLSQREAAKLAMPKIKMFLTDCDGTLTDGGMYYSAGGEEMKKFNTRDGLGLRLLQERGIVTGIVSGEISEALRRRAVKLRVSELEMGAMDKLTVIKSLCAKHNLNLAQVAYIGDDLNDVEAIVQVGFGICVGDGQDEAKLGANYVTNLPGGGGAVREAADLIMQFNVR